MATSLLLPTRSAILQTALQEFQDNLPGASTAVGGSYAIIANTIAAVTWPVYQPIAFLADQIFPSSASAEFLQRHGNLYRIQRKAASSASGMVRLSGLAGSTQTANTTFTDAQGQVFTFTSNATIATPVWANTTIVQSSPKTPDRFQAQSITGMAVGDALTIGGNTFIIRDLPGSNMVILWGRIPSTTFNGNTNINGLTVAPGTGAVIPWKANFTGISGNLPLNSLVTIGTPGAGITATATVVFSGDGADTQTNAAWASFMEQIRAEYPAGGNRSQLAFWSMGYLTKQDRDEGRQSTYALGVERAFIWPLFRGPGTADSTPQGAPGARHLSTARRGEIQDRIFPINPQPNNPGLVAMGADIAVTDFTDLVQDISLTVYGTALYPPDYDASGPFLIQAGTTTTRLLLLPNPVGTISIDDRVCLMSGGRLVQARVTNVFGTGIDIDTPLVSVPPNNTGVYQGSDLIIPIRDAIDAMFATLGPGDTTPPSRWPAPNSEEPAELHVPYVHRYVMGVPGVRTMTVSTPGGSVIPSPKQQIVLGSLFILHRA